ncbi:MAG: hypothetical protein LQ352_008162, partial [Teloschistes flavicans]
MVLAALILIIFQAPKLIALDLPTNNHSPLPFITNVSSLADDTAKILCYDPRYARRIPALDECAAIISHDILAPRAHVHQRRQFCRRHSGRYLPLPHTWNSERGGCRVVIDTPGEDRIVEASFWNIQSAGYEIMTHCVILGDHLGGIMQTGVRRELQ